MNTNTDSTGYITEPLGNMVDNYVDTLGGFAQIFNTLPNDAVGWNEYNSSNKILIMSLSCIYRIIFQI